MPRVFYSRGAAELISFDGEPQWATIPGTDLAYATNTDSNFFIDYSTNRFYYLTSGRWFTALQRTGPWAFASDRLPADFAKIPADSPAAHCLAQRAGHRLSPRGRDDGADSDPGRGEQGRCRGRREGHLSG